MNKYNIKLLPRAYRDLDDIYRYIINEFKELETAKQMVELLETAILGLNILPYRGATRKIGSYAYKGYRQLFVKNFTIIYRINEENKDIIIVTVRYTPSSF